ncbi:MAG: NACHT domain-containing protein, partial [Gammaproteobacteria bacterium]|nr:NACHT domain-containing protein [Gammaproteobacteria bacterium]
MTEGLAIWGLAQAAQSIFTPILEDLAKGVAEDAAKSYVGKSFESVFSVIHKAPLTKATGQALKELLDLIENELLDADWSEDDVRGMMPRVKQFIEHQEVCGCLKPLFLEPGYRLDPKTFADAWAQPETPELPENFSWHRIAKRFSRKVRDIRNNSKGKETFDTLQNGQNADAIKEFAGLPPDFDLDKYREALAERFGNLSFDSLDTSGGYYNAVRLWNVFVPQSARECRAYRPQLLEIPKEHQQHLLDRGEIDAQELRQLEKIQTDQRRAYFEQPLRPVLEVCADPDLPYMVILGDPGSGKSTLLRFLALQWARNENINERYSQPLPLLIELRDYNRWHCPGGNKSFPRYLHEGPNWHRLNRQTLNYLLKQPDRVVLLLDGLDEVFDPVQREQVMNDIFRFSSDYKHTRIILTSRVVGYKAERLHDAEFRDFMLQDLDEAQIGSFLDRWHEVTFEDKNEADHKRLRLIKAIREAKSINMLAGNPLLLTMMAIINRYQELPRDRVLLYEKAAEVLLQQWDTERSLQDFPGLSTEIDLRAKTAILRKIAYTMQTGKEKGEAANIIQGDILTGLIEEYLYQELHFDQARNAANVLMRQLRERNFILCYLGADSYAFVHRTFLEYFCAADFVVRFHKEKSLSLEELIAVFDQHCREDDWSEVLRLICGQIDEGFVGQIVEHLATRTDLKAWDGSPLPEIPLAIYCFCEVWTHSKLANAGGILANSVIQMHTTASPCYFVNDLETAIRELGTNWPGIPNLKIASDNVCSKIKNGNCTAGNWPKFVALAGNDRTLTTSLIEHSNHAIAKGSVEALAEKWPDDDTRRLLCGRAVQDEHEHPRGAALEALARYWPDDGTRRLL